ncbi:DUF4136 domain-containing protein [Pararhodonellum marinum]|uniref:DUF4136 domain-containing protein n=1 Tax=Pararhodonellum marinum TaxID=2755358 RepID=UPI00188F5891|nr:DUF4136 domain-containing protein [Pararhodonellum marinum]
MKNTSYLFILLLIIASACFSQRDFIAEYDYNYRGNFKKYKTFGFLEIMNVDSTSHEPTIEKSITSRLGAQGYRMNLDKPDLLISYKLFYSEVRYRGYVQPEFEMWVRNQSEEVDYDEEDKLENRNKGEDYNKVKYVENEGMLVIFVIDNKKGNTIWQGYTSAQFDYNSPNINLDLARATYRIMDQFKVVTRNSQF